MTEETTPDVEQWRSHRQRLEIRESLLAVLPGEPFCKLTVPRIQGELQALGRENLKCVVARLRNQEQLISTRIGELKSALGLLSHFGPELVAKTPKKAVRFVTHMPTSSLEGSLTHIPDEPTLIARREGDTNYRYCGWCVHRASGVYRADAMLYGDCDVLTAAGEPYEQDVASYTPCVVAAWTAAERSAVLAQLKDRAESEKTRRESIRRTITAIRELGTNALARPIFPGWRPARHFKEGQRVVFYKVSVHDLMLPGVEPWIVGRVMGEPGGTLVIKLCAKVTRGELLDGRGVQVPVQAASVLSVEEFEDLKRLAASRSVAHRRFLSDWLSVASQERRGFDADEFVLNLRKGAVRTA